MSIRMTGGTHADRVRSGVIDSDASIASSMAAGAVLREDCGSRLMRRQGVAVDEAVCFVALRVCFNALRELWTPGGYPPGSGMDKVHTQSSHHAAASKQDARDTECKSTYLCHMCWQGHGGPFSP